MKTKKMVSLVLALTLMLCVSIPSFSLDSAEEQLLPTTFMNEIRAIAQNSPKFFPDTSNWGSVSITKETPLYDGWDGHALAGVGYFYVSDNMSPKYLIVHTTNIPDVKVYANLSALGSYAYFMIRP